MVVAVVVVVTFAEELPATGISRPRVGSPDDLAFHNFTMSGLAGVGCGKSARVLVLSSDIGGGTAVLGEITGPTSLASKFTESFRLAIIHPPLSVQCELHQTL